MPLVNWVDVIVVLTLAIYAIQGFRFGLARCMAELAAFLISIFVAMNLYASAAYWLGEYFFIPKSYAKALGFFAVWVFTMWIAVFVFRQIFGIFSWWGGKLLDKILGIIPSVASGLIALGIIFTLVIALPVSQEAKQEILASKIGSALTDRASSFENFLEGVFGQAIEESLTFLTINPEGTKFIDLGYKLANPVVSEAMENKMLDLVNQERVKAGVKTLKADEALRAVAREHSEDMFQRGYFSHLTPEGKTLTDRLREGNVSYIFAGENLALAPTVEIAMDGLIKSPGHRQNILSENFNKIGIGAMDGGQYGIIFTQNFTN